MRSIGASWYTVLSSWNAFYYPKSYLKAVSFLMSSVSGYTILE